MYYLFINDLHFISRVIKHFSSSLLISSDDKYINEKAKKIARKGIMISAFDSKNDRVIGFATFYSNNLSTKVAFLSMLAVDEKKRNTGVGSTLLSIVEETSYENGMRFLRLEVRKTNKIAIEFYIKKGFSIESSATETYYMMKHLQ